MKLSFLGIVFHSMQIYGLKEKLFRESEKFMIF